MSDPAILARGVLGRELPVERIHAKRSHVTVERITLPDGCTLVVKRWSRPLARALLRRVLRDDPVSREARALATLSRAGARVPRPIAHCSLLHAAQVVHVLFLEDLGRCPRATARVKELLHAGRLDELRDFEEEVIDLTGTILGSGIVDTDHSFRNLLVDGRGDPVRIDFELARSRPFWGEQRAIGQMLGRLVASYAFAVQPETDRVDEFARRLAEHLRVDRRAREEARETVNRMMGKQHRETGIDSRVELPW